jgi:hypothetical protein
MFDYLIVRSEQEIESLLEQCLVAENEGSDYPGMSYEQGIKCAIEWVIGHTDEHPLNSEDF